MRSELNQLTPELRLLFWAILGVIVPFGFLLYFLPASTDAYWAWTILEPRSAVLIGAGYIGAISYYAASLRLNDWSQTKSGLGGLIVFCVYLLVATMAHWGTFKPYHPTTLVWLLFYYVGPLLVPIVYRSQVSQEKPQSTEQTPLRQGARLWLIGRGFLYLSLSLLWIGSATSVSVAWPWAIEPLDLRVFAGQIAIVGWNSVIAIQSPKSWKAYRLGMFLTFSIGVIQCAGLLFGGGAYDTTSGLGRFLPIIFAEWVITPTLLHFLHKRGS